MRHLIWLLVLASACTDEVTIASGVCGNYVLEPGEDCDRPGGACTSECRIACDVTQRATACTSADAIDGTCCPTGSICGVDNVCHKPTGTLQPTEIVVPFDVDSLTFSDIDGDLIADAIGVSPTSAQVRYGAASAPLATSATTPVPPGVTSQVGFGDFDGDGRIDIAIPTQSGLFALSTQTGTPKPITFPAAIQTSMRHERIAAGVMTTLLGPIAGTVELDFTTSPGTGESPYQLNMFLTPTFAVPSLTPFDGDHAPCGITNLSSSLLRGHAIHPFIDDRTVRVPLLVGRTTVGVCVDAANPNHLPVGALGSYAIPLNILTGTTYHVSTSGETFFANLVSAKGSCPDLVVPVFDSNDRPFSLILHGKGTFNTDQCTIDTTVAPVVLAGKPFAEIDMSATGAALITSAGIYTNLTTGAQVAMPATRPWSYVAVGDLQGDGLEDFVTIGAANDVEVFRQVKPPPLVLAPMFVDLLIPTADPVADIALGNFDGDLGGGIAIATIDDSGNGELSIAWGSIDTTFTVADIGALQEFQAMTSTNLLDVSMPPNLDHNDDLVIAIGGANPQDMADPALLVTEYGSTSRALTAPFVDTSSFGGSQQLHGAGVIAEIGSFGQGGAPGVFALFQPSPAGLNVLTAPPPDNLSMLDLTYETFGSFAQSAEGLQSAPCVTGAVTDTPFCPSNAAFSRVLHTGGDLLIALREDVEADPRSQCAAYFLALPDATPSLATMSCADLAPAAVGSPAYTALVGVGRVGARYHVDNVLRLEVDVTKRHAEQAFLWQLDVDASGRPQLSNPIAIDDEIAASGLLPAGAKAMCTDSAEVELGHRVVAGVTYGSGLNELVSMCNVVTGNVYATTLFARYTDPGGGPPHYEQLVDLGKDIDTRVRAADVNGDGLTDIIYTVGSSTSGHQDVHVLLQCDAHQTGCKGGS